MGVISPAMTRLVQIGRGHARAVALCEEPRLHVLDRFASVFDLAQAAIARREPLVDVVRNTAVVESLDYDAIYTGRSDWRLLTPIDHPHQPTRCLVSGTGLTHLGSAAQRQQMHEAVESELTDSMKMFRLGLSGGKPAAGAVGVAPEWFYKGNGTILRAHGEPLDVPGFAEDGGEEAEIAGVYVIGAEGLPYRVGMAIGNEFSDHVFERKNYLNLAGSKLRTCAIGPELVVDPAFDSVPGTVTVIRDGATLWSKDIVTGEQEMSHSLRNIEHHHFKFELHRRAGDVHVHYFGACALSFGDGLRLADGDIMEVAFTGFGRPLRNAVRDVRGDALPFVVTPLG
jgi:hypothetical protein